MRIAGARMTLLPLILGVSASLGLCMLALVAFHNWAYKAGVKAGEAKGEVKGYGAGFAQGKKAGDDWWIQAESEVDAARVKIWREEAQL